MSVSAQAVSDRSSAASVELIDLRADPSVLAGTFEWAGPDARTTWHRHPYHQLEYAVTGTIEVETAAGRYLLPPQQAVWIPAGLAHVSALRDVRSVSAFIDPSLAPAPDDRARVLAAAPVIREMLVYATRWPIDRRGTDAAADAFFGALATVVLDWLARETPLHLPTSTDPVLAGALAHVDANLATATLTSASRAAHVSERTLRRRLADELGTTWRAYVTQCRLLRAAALLAHGERTVLDVATAVGFDSPSSFTRAFQQLLGETPSAYRGRMTRRRAR